MFYIHLLPCKRKKLLTETVCFQEGAYLQFSSQLYDVCVSDVDLLSDCKFSSIINCEMCPHPQYILPISCHLFHTRHCLLKQIAFFCRQVSHLLCIILIRASAYIFTMSVIFRMVRIGFLFFIQPSKKSSHTFLAALKIWLNRYFVWPVIFSQLLYTCLCHANVGQGNEGHMQWPDDQCEDTEKVPKCGAIYLWWLLNQTLWVLLPPDALQMFIDR